MNLAVTWIRALAIAGSALAAGCGTGELNTSGTGSSSSGTSTGNASAAGIWTGTDSASGLGLTGIIDSGGVADFLRSDGTQYGGVAQVSGGTLVIALDVTTQFGTQFGDGSSYGVGTLNATLVAQSSLVGSISFTTSDNNTLSSNWSL